MTPAHSRERSVALAIAALGVVLAVVRPAYFSPDNLVDLVLSNLGVAVAAVGATLVMVTGEIDISIGSMFAWCSILAGAAAVEGMPTPIVALLACAAGGTLGAINGTLVAYAGIPSIVVTLASMIALRDGLRWAMQGEWISGLPDGFQWLGVSRTNYPLAAATLVAAVAAAAAWLLHATLAGRAIYAVGSNADAARLAGIRTARVRCAVFVAAGVLTGLGALLNAVRFQQIPSNGGLGLELKVIAAVVVGGVSVTGGQGTIAGTMLGVMLLGALGPALTFLGVSAYWERALQGAIILTAIAGGVTRAARLAAAAPAASRARL